MAFKKKKKRVIIVGAGIAGLGAAMGLAQAGQEVLVISQKRKGVSSPAAGGILDPFLEMTPQHPLFRISREAFLQYPALIRRIESKTGMRTGYKRTGMLFIAMNDGDLRELKRRYAWQRKTGISSVWLSREEVLRKYPAVTPELLAGLFYPAVARIQPRNLIPALETYAQSLGVQFLLTKQNPVLLVPGKAAAGVRIGKKDYSSDAVINATGAWAGLGEVSPKLPVRPAKGQILMVQSREKMPVILHSLDGGYIVPWDEAPVKQGVRKYLLGSTVENAGFNSRTTAAGLRKILQKNRRILPGLENSRPAGNWSGLRPFSEKKIPFIGPSKIKGLYLACGYYRSGILIGCYAGELLAKAVVSGKMPQRIKPFDPRKFSL